MRDAADVDPKTDICPSSNRGALSRPCGPSGAFGMLALQYPLMPPQIATSSRSCPICPTESSTERRTVKGVNISPLRGHRGRRNAGIAAGGIDRRRSEPRASEGVFWSREGRS